MFDAVPESLTLHTGGRATAVLACVCTEPETIASLADELQCSPNQIQNALRQLRMRGLVEPTIGGKGGSVIPTERGRRAIAEHLRRVGGACRR